MRYLYMMNIYNEIGMVSMVEHLTLTEREIIAIIRRNNTHFARKVLAFVFGMDKAIWKKKKDLELDVESSVRMEDET